MAEAPELPPDPLASLPPRADVVQPDPPLSRLPRVGVVLAAGRSERLESVTGGGSKALFRLGGLSLVERAVRSLLAAGLERVLIRVAIARFGWIWGRASWARPLRRRPPTTPSAWTQQSPPGHSGMT